MNHEYTLDDLAPGTQRLFEQAYENRKRRQASREDCLSGYIQALIDVRAKSMFKEGRWREAAS